MSDRNVPVVIERKELLRGHVFSVVDLKLRNTDGSERQRRIVEHPGAVIIIPRTEQGTFLLVDQYRAALGNYLLEFPAGTLELAEEPRACAERELAEEVGRKALRWTSLGKIYPAPGFCSEVQHAFLAEGLSDCPQKFDEDEIIEVLEMSSQQISQAVVAGRLVDGKSLALLSLLREHRL